jgi:NadR type nicotinamide-nucleotide adenylyltransferase
MGAIKKVVILGPESTGKSTLSAQLAAHYNSIWVEEYARDYLLQHGTQYSFDDLLRVAQGQVGLEEAALQQMAQEGMVPASASGEANVPLPPVFLDTDMYVMKVWCEFVFGQCHYYILDQIANRTYDLYLLCNIDLPWVKDELREYPDEQPRKELYHMYRDLLINQPVPWVTISGGYAERLSAAIVAVDALLQRG